MNKTMKLLCSLLLAVASTPLLWAQNTTQTVTQVTSAVTLTEPVNYVITGTTPFATAGSIDIQNDDAVIIFTNVRPATAKNYLNRISIHGVKANRDSNCWLEIHLNGAIIYPHTELTFKPLTVYTEKNFSGESYNDFIPYTKYTSGDWVNNVRSFKLKRGYMATFACNPNGSGWSKVFIAQDGDLEIDFSKVSYGKYIAGREGFIRVFPWRNVTKKGTAGDPGLQDQLNITWMYGWGGGMWHNDYLENVPQRHHLGWPGWGDFNNTTGANTLLGDNEPDNERDSREKYTPVDEIEQVFFINDNWPVNAYLSGMRVGSPAMSGDARGGWLSKFIELCEKYNCRIDFIADHCYWHDPASSFDWQMNTTYEKYHRPIWITEWNYGANWTSWESGDHSYNDTNANIELNAVSSICTALENNVHVERYAFYNWVEDCRAIVYNNVTRDSEGNVISSETILTKAGEWYANLKSNSAYNTAGEYTMGWTYANPENLTVTAVTGTKRANINWKHMNGKQTDSVYVERKVSGESRWTVIHKLYSPSSTTLNATDDLTGLSGLITYRVRNFDSDGNTRTTGDASITVSGTSGSVTLQYGTLILANADEKVTVTYDYSTPVKPAVFTGLMTYKNANTVTTPFFKSTSIDKQKFDYIGIPWQKQKNSSSTFTSKEELPFMVITPGNYQFGELQAEVGQVKLKDTVDVVFNQPFPEGVTPVVIATVNVAANESKAIMHKIWDVTNTGFRCNVMYEDGELKANGSHLVPTNNHTVSYFAVSPGDGCVDAESGTYLAAGLGSQLVSGSTPSAEYFIVNSLNQEGETVNDTLRLLEPVIFADTQTRNLPTPQLLRTRGNITEAGVDAEGEPVTYTTGVNIRRVVDESVTSGLNIKNGPTADRIGWIAIHSNPVTPHTALPQNLESTYTGNELNIRVINRIVYVEGFDDFELFTLGGVRAASNATQTPGIYIVRAGGKTAKVVIN